MGQYYTPYIENEEGKFTLYSHDYGNGLKLMEHSWMGNEFVNAVYTMIENNPSVVAWVGDYAEPEEGEVQQEIYDICWRSDDAFKATPKPKNFFIEDGVVFGEGCLINHSKRQYVDLMKYCSFAEDDTVWHINPLPLLTAIGNGRGGGDYHDCYPNYNMVGIWAMDRIEFRPFAIEGYTDITEDVVFVERS